jgi:hypothetical protein
MAKSRSQSNGKLIDTWWYEYSGIPAHQSDDPEAEPEVKPIKVPIKVYILKKFKGDTPPLATKEVWFEVTCENPEFSFTGPDIESLRATMWGELDDHYKVGWEEYYLVSIDHRAPYEGMGTGLSFGYETVWKGTAFDGTLLLKQYRYGRGEVIEPWPGEFKDKRGNVTACIPANKVNRAALEEFTKRIDILREKLVDLVRPEKIDQTLLTLSTNKLLPSGDD